MRSRSFSVAAVSVCLAAGGVVGVAPTASAAEVRPHISTVVGMDAPVGQKGGISAPTVWCSDYETTPRVTWVITNLRTHRADPQRWSDEGNLPARVAPGTYRSTTRATCAGTRATRSQRIVVEQKTARGTISRGEFRRIEAGMSSARVGAIVGNAGELAFADGDTTWRVYERMDFGMWAQVELRNDRVVSKAWTVEAG